MALRSASLFLSTLLLSAAIAGAQQIHHVPGQYPSIQIAINAANPGDQIWVSPGTYFENINYMGKDLRLLAIEGPEFTTINGGNRGIVVRFHSQETRAARLEGFTITRGRAELPVTGAGVSISGASPVVRNCRIVSNRGCSTAGIFVRGGSPRIENNYIALNRNDLCLGSEGEALSASIADGMEFVGNTVAHHSGISCSFFASGPCLIAGNTFMDNGSLATIGNVIAAFNTSPLTIESNLFLRNQSGLRGAIRLSSPGVRIEGNTFVENASTVDGSAVSTSESTVMAGNIFVSSAQEAVIHCDGISSNLDNFHDNTVFATTGFAGNCQDPGSVRGNRRTDPQFAAPHLDDYTLAPHSEFIDYRNTTGFSWFFDREFGPRFSDGNSDWITRADVGAFEFRRVRLRASRVPTAGQSVDLTLDGTFPADASLLMLGTQQAAYTIEPFGTLLVEPLAPLFFSPLFPSVPFTLTLTPPLEAGGLTMYAQGLAIQLAAGRGFLTNRLRLDILPD